MRICCNLEKFSFDIWHLPQLWSFCSSYSGWFHLVKWCFIHKRNAIASCQNIGQESQFHKYIYIYHVYIERYTLFSSKRNWHISWRNCICSASSQPTSPHHSSHFSQNPWASGRPHILLPGLSRWWLKIDSLTRSSSESNCSVKNGSNTYSVFVLFGHL